MPRTPLSVRVVHLSVLEPTAQGAPDRYVDIRVELGPEAVTDGLLQRLSGNALKVLVALARHLRPLVGAELDHAIQLGLATPDDAGKLTTFVTDVALANELQLYRATVQKALQEWEAEGLLTITTAPYPARTLDGRYQLGRLVMLSLAAGQAVRTGPTPLSRAEKSSTAAPSAPITPTRAEKNSTVRAEKSSTKSDDVDVDVDVDDRLSEEDNTIFQAFAAARRQAYRPTARDRALLAQLRAAGYQPAEILAAIQRGVANALATGQRPRRFSYVVPIVREQPPGATPARLVVLPEVTPPVQPGPAEEPAAQPAVAVPQVALHQTSTEPAPVLSGPVNADWATLQNFCAARGLPLTPAQLQDLLVLARDYAAAAARVEQTGLDWVLAALQAVDSSVAHPVRYVRAILKQWQAQPPPPRRPAAAPVTAADEAATGADDAEDDVENQAAPAVAPPPTAPEPASVTLADGTTQPVAQLWHRTLTELELQMTRATFDTWLRDSAGVGLADPTTLTVQVKNQYAVEWLENRLAPVIQRTLYRLTGQALGIQFVAAR